VRWFDRKEDSGNALAENENGAVLDCKATQTRASVSKTQRRSQTIRLNTISMKPKINYSEERREKKNIYASDYGKLGIDIFFSLHNEPVTNPMHWSSLLRMAAGKGVEMQMLQILKANGNVPQDYSQDGDSIKIERLGVPISMKFDALGKQSKLDTDDITTPETACIDINEGEPVEIKSINNKNSFDIAKYENNEPRESYVGQLAIYMDALNKERGHLFVSSIDGLNYFWFVVTKIGEGLYQCGNTKVDLNKEYARFKAIYDLKEITDELIWEEKYKIPLEEIDWTKLSTSAIGDCRNGRKVIGTENKWKLDYSSWKNRIVELQKAELGYNPSEIELIKSKTAGFSSKKTLKTK